MLDPKHLRAIQNAGWIIAEVDQKSVTVSCPNAGCGLRLRMLPGKPVPAACTPHLARQDVVLQGSDHGRKVLRARREELGLSIKEAEEVVGAAGDHLAKAEKDDPSRIPNVQIFKEWAEGLGYDLVLRPRPLPLLTLRVIAENRDRLKARSIMLPHHRAKREP